MSLRLCQWFKTYINWLLRWSYIHLFMSTNKYFPRRTNRCISYNKITGHCCWLSNVLWSGMFSAGRLHCLHWWSGFGVWAVYVHARKGPFPVGLHLRACHLFESMAVCVWTCLNWTRLCTWIFVVYQYDCIVALIAISFGTVPSYRVKAVNHSAVMDIVCWLLLFDLMTCLSIHALCRIGYFVSV